jgi:hypothetical protein
MSERDLDARLNAIERALTDDDADLSDLRQTTAALDDLDGLESRVTEIESRLDELEAGLEAVRGYAGNVRAVNRDVERRASAALAKAETLENAVENRPDTTDRKPNATEQVDPDPVTEHRTRDQAPPSQPAGGAGGRAADAPRSTGRRPEGENDDSSRPQPRRSRDDRADAGTSESRDGESQTEQFIERVRDAL